MYPTEYAPIGIRIVLGPGELNVSLPEYRLEPPALDKGKVPNDPKQARTGRDHRAHGILTRQSLDLPHHHAPVGVEDFG